MSHIHHFARPYLKTTFSRLLIAGGILLVIINVSLYSFMNEHIFSLAQDSAKQIAINVASNIPTSLHENLTNPSQQSSDEYKVLENYFQIVTDSNPRVDDVYTLRPTSNPNIMTFVVSADVDADGNGDGIIDETELKPRIGEEYDISDQPDLQATLTLGPSADSHITYDKWGAWISGYAPLYDISGKAVAIVGVDIAAKFITDQRLDVVRSLMLIDIAAIILMFTTAYLVARRLTQEFNILAEGMDQLTHGNIDYELPLSYHGRGAIFKILFHDMVMMFKNIEKDKAETMKQKKEKYS